MGKRHTSRNFDDFTRRKVRSALLMGDGETIHQLSIAGGRSENNRRECRRVADLVLRREGGFPVPEIEPLPLPSGILNIIVESPSIATNHTAA